ncbi:MAG TPA: EthD domain-containing protein [Spongiibacteraceae bacterium]|nr:EthD domain-containing protein [Spongiibacteraceae bacterium]
MIYTLAYLCRKSSLSRAEFSEYYESRHTKLARHILPEFSHYRRNHVLESTDDAQCPDSFSEFAYDCESKLLETMSIVGGERGRELMDDELNFMDKIRNQIYPATPLGQLAPVVAEYKYVVVVRGESAAIDAWIEGWRSIDSDVQDTLTYSEVGADGAQQLHWLMAWSNRQVPLQGLQADLVDRGVPVLWCARVDECRGYPQ